MPTFKSSRRLISGCLAVIGIAWLGCRTPASFPPIDFNQSGWQTRTGQAIWQPGRDKPEIVGDLIVSIHPIEGAYLQFSKAFPIVMGRVRETGWEAEFPPQNKRYAGPGNPPKRIVWLQLLRELSGRGASTGWRVSSSSGEELLMENFGSGERLEIHF